MSTPLQTSGAGTPGTATPQTEAKALLTVPGQSPLHRVKNVPGYSTPVFKGKEEQRAQVQANIAKQVCTISTSRCSHDQRNNHWYTHW